eukprot:2950680-Rhodomonas_salina.1
MRMLLSSPTVPSYAYDPGVLIPPSTIFVYICWYQILLYPPMLMSLTASYAYATTTSFGNCLCVFSCHALLSWYLPPRMRILPPTVPSFAYTHTDSCMLQHLLPYLCLSETPLCISQPLPWAGSNSRAWMCGIDPKDTRLRTCVGISNLTGVKLFTGQNLATAIGCILIGLLSVVAITLSILVCRKRLGLAPPPSAVT